MQRNTLLIDILQTSAELNKVQKEIAKIRGYEYRESRVIPPPNASTTLLQKLYLTVGASLKVAQKELHRLQKLDNNIIYDDRSARDDKGTYTKVQEQMSCLVNTALSHIDASSEYVSEFIIVCDFGAPLTADINEETEVNDSTQGGKFTAQLFGNKGDSTVTVRYYVDTVGINTPSRPLRTIAEFKEAVANPDPNDYQLYVSFDGDITHSKTVKLSTTYQTLTPAPAQPEQPYQEEDIPSECLFSASFSSTQTETSIINYNNTRVASLTYAFPKPAYTEIIQEMIDGGNGSMKTKKINYHIELPAGLLNWWNESTQTETYGAVTLTHKTEASPIGATNIDFSFSSETEMTLEQWKAVFDGSTTHSGILSSYLPIEYANEHAILVSASFTYIEDDGGEE